MTTIYPTIPHTRGYIALVAVLIASAVMLIAALAATRTGIQSTSETTAEEAALHARLLADACAEEGILRLRSNLAYAGNESVVVNTGDSCIIGSVSGSGPNNRVIRGEAVVLGYVRRVELTIASATPVLNIAQWKTVANFSP